MVHPSFLILFNAAFSCWIIAGGMQGGGLFPDTLDGKQNLGAIGGGVLAGGFHRDGGTVQIVGHLRCHAQGGRAVVTQRKVTVRCCLNN